MTTQTDSPTLFPEGELPDRFIPALKRYGTWPTTVWEIDHQDHYGQRLMDAVGDDGAARKGCLNVGYKSSKNSSKQYTSIFSPQLTAYILNMFAPEEGLCIDPFAGGGTRAILAAKRGLSYLGTELRELECEATRQRIHKAGVWSKVQIAHADARHLGDYTTPHSADFCYTCPPYWNLEKYDGGPRDLSQCATLADFQVAVQEVATVVRFALKSGSFSCWVIGLHRNAKGWLLPLHHIVTAAHLSAGYSLKEEVIVHHTHTGSIQRVGQFEKGRKHLVRVHEYVLVFVAK